jgi:hypothetical protein
MLEYRFILTEHDPARPWLVIGAEHRTVTLDDDVNFFAWARGRWSEPRWSVELEPRLSEWPRG